MSFTYYNNLTNINKINYDFNSNSNINLMTQYFGDLAKNKVAANLDFGNFKVDFRAF